MSSRPTSPSSAQASRKRGRRAATAAIAARRRSPASRASAAVELGARRRRRAPAARSTAAPWTSRSDVRRSCRARVRARAPPASPYRAAVPIARRVGRSRPSSPRARVRPTSRESSLGARRRRASCSPSWRRRCRQGDRRPSSLTLGRARRHRRRRVVAARVASQDCADRGRATTLAAGAVDDTTCTFFGREVTVDVAARLTQLDEHGGDGVGVGVRPEVAGALDRRRPCSRRAPRRGGPSTRWWWAAPRVPWIATTGTRDRLRVPRRGAAAGRRARRPSPRPRRGGPRRVRRRQALPPLVADQPAHEPLGGVGRVAARRQRVAAGRRRRPPVEPRQRRLVHADGPHEVGSPGGQGEGDVAAVAVPEHDGRDDRRAAATRSATCSSMPNGPGVRRRAAVAAPVVAQHAVASSSSRRESLSRPAERSIDPWISTTSGAPSGPASSDQIARRHCDLHDAQHVGRRAAVAVGRAGEHEHDVAVLDEPVLHGRLDGEPHHLVARAVLLDLHRLDAPRQRQRVDRARVRRQPDQPGARAEPGHRPGRAPAARAAQDRRRPGVDGGLPRGVRDGAGDAVGGVLAPTCAARGPRRSAHCR